MGQTAKYCEECSQIFKALPVGRQNQKQQDFLSASHFSRLGAPVDYKKLRTEMAVCEDCGQLKIVQFYLL